MSSEFQKIVKETGLSIEQVENTFCQLKTRNFQSLFSKVSTFWKANPAEMENLMHDAITYNLSTDAINNAKALILKGSSYYSVNIFMERDYLLKEIEELKAKLANGGYTKQEPEVKSKFGFVYSEDEFFSPDTCVLEQQLKDLIESAKRDTSEGNEYVFKLFGISKGFTQEQLKAIKKALARQYHPDRTTYPSSVMATINTCYDILLHWITDLAPRYKG